MRLRCFGKPIIKKKAIQAGRGIIQGGTPIPRGVKAQTRLIIKRKMIKRRFIAA